MNRHRVRLVFCALAASGVALAGPGPARGFDYVITFDNVSVQGLDPADTPEMAHLDAPEANSLTTPPDRETARPKPSDHLAAPLPKIVARAPDSLLPFAPGRGTANPSFVEAGFFVEAFWAVKTGTRDGYFKRGHFHPADLSSGFEAQHLGHPNELHGLYIRSLDGKPFGLKSLRYRVTRNRQIPGKPVSIEGFSNFSVSVLVARSFDPRGPILAQFVSFPVGLPVGNDLTLPWWPLRIFGFERVEQVYIASSASVDLDEIVLTRSTPPEPPADAQEETK